MKLAAVRLIALSCCLFLTMLASIAFVTHAVSAFERLVIGLGIASMASEVWLAYIARDSFSPVAKVFGRALTLLALTYAGWFGSDAWFRFIEDAGYHDQALVDRVNRAHLLNGVLAYCAVTLITTVAVSGPRLDRLRRAVAERHRPASGAYYWGILLVLLTAGLCLLVSSDRRLAIFGLCLILANFLLGAVGLVSRSRAAFWACVAEMVAAAIVVGAVRH